MARVARPFLLKDARQDRKAKHRVPTLLRVKKRILKIRQSKREQLRQKIASKKAALAHKTGIINTLKLDKRLRRFKES